MAKKKASSYMTPGEQIAGVVFLAIYLVVLTFAADPLWRFLCALVDAPFSALVRQVIYYWVPFVTAILIFHKFLGRTSRNFVDNLGIACRSVLLGLVGIYGLCELVWQLTNLVLENALNLNGGPISAYPLQIPAATVLACMVLVPVVEEALFRGLVFGNLKHKSRVVAYLVSALLFAAFHVWQFTAMGKMTQDAYYLLLLLQYLVPGAVLAWAYESSGTLWASIGLHAVVNALGIVTTL